MHFNGIIDDQYQCLSYQYLKDIINQSNRIATSLLLRNRQSRTEDSLWRLRKLSPQGLIECTNAQKP
jgi:hypothetical protein